MTSAPKVSHGLSTRIINTLRPRQNGQHFPENIFKCIFLSSNVWILLKISLQFVPKVRINNIPALVQIMARGRPGNKPLSAPMMVSLLMHICSTRTQWVKYCFTNTLPEPVKESSRHDDIITWQHLPHRWPFVRGILFNHCWIPLTLGETTSHQ